ncbi:MAG: oligosaccharide flippase family protein [Cyclobacteriaceae bacterium]
MLRRVIQYISSLRKSFLSEGSFGQNLAITFSGNVLAQLIGFAFTPFIARIYGPEAYGVFALFIAVVNNVSPLSTLQFPSGYVAAENDREFIQMVQITFLVLLVGTLFVFGSIFIFKYELIRTFSLIEINAYLIWVPVYYFLMGVDNILLGWNIRLKEFKRGAVAKIFSTSLSKGTAILYGVLAEPVALGIVIGNLLSYPFESFVKFGPTIKREAAKLFKDYNWLQLRIIFLKYRAYPTYLTTGTVVSNLSNQLPIYFLSIWFDQGIVGLFALANSMVNLPLALIINSSTTVFLQKAAETIQNSGPKLKSLVTSLYQKLLLLSFVPLVVLALISEWLFVLVFGAEWEQSGVFASILCMGVIFSVPSTPLSVLFRLMNKERIVFITNVIFVGIKFFGLWLGLYYGSIKFSVIGFSLATFFTNLVALFIIFRMVKISIWILVRDAVIVVAIMAIIFLLNV